ncbi:MAG: KpsF/GutQ family sugar-phosphate isomerase [Verrucomicrobiota bacterium]|nr:KpsF/GutQ family sugar-phosphate isomerase [Verrucomicrobiota bacterium]
MFPQLIADLQSHLARFFSSFPTQAAERALEKAISCRGMIFCTGAGKSGHIAQKMAATLASTGTRAAFLSPTQAVHGDLGLVSESDLVFLLSKSGETAELLQLLPFLKARNVKTIAIVSAEHSRLAKETDLAIHLPVERELCPYNLAPTTSTIVQLIFSDCLAMALMAKKSFSLPDFAANHPGGLIGRKIGYRVSDLMLKGDALPLCRTSDKLLDLLHELSAKRCGCLLVQEQAKCLGIFSDGDLRRLLELQGSNALTLPMSKLMTPNPRSIGPNALAIEALHHMEEDRPITVLPVIQEGTLVGLIRLHDILRADLTSC